MTKNAEVMSWKVEMSPGHHKLAPKLEEHSGYERGLIWRELSCPAKNYFQ